ncbi:uncharacterized protein [Asterias amurensis]|uniref:uncharacterized protein n=1 Tax=Asterias amurensis TaxID=7602 RepID=UPI003AB35E22
MSLGCVFVRKGHYFNQQEQDVVTSRPSWDDVSPFDFTQALHGFLLMMTRQGKLLYISENVTDYLGHSMVELLSTGGDLYEVIDPRDHAVVRAQMAVAGSNCGTETECLADEDRTFFCRMNTSRNMRRKDHCTDNKMVRIKGRFRILWSGCCYNWNQVEPVFTAVCSPVETLTPISDEMVPLKTSMFTTEHGMDMVIYDVSSNVFFHLGYESSELSAMSWYTLIHPDYVETARKYHQQMLQPSIGTAASRCAFVLRLLRKDNAVVTVSVTAWLDRDSTVNHAAVIMCQNLVIREDEIAMYESQALHETLARRSAPCLVSPRPPSASGSSERFSCGPSGDDGSSPWPEQGPHAEENTPCSVDTAPLYGYTNSGGQTQHRYVGDSTQYQYLVSHGDTNDWRYDSESCYYQENQFNTMSCHQLKVENAGWEAPIHSLPHHEAAGRAIFPGNYGPYSSVLLGPARARQSVRPRKDGIVDGCDFTLSHTTTREPSVGSDPCPALKRAVLEWARRLKVKRQIMTSYKKQEQCFPSLEYKEKSRKRSHRETSVPASPVPLYKSEIDYVPCVATLTRMEPPAKRFIDGTIQVNNQPHTVNNLTSPLQNPEEHSFNIKGYTSSVGIPQVEPHWWPTSGGEVRVPDGILTPESSPSHEDPPGKMRPAFGTSSSACSPESSKPARQQQDDRHASDEEPEPIVGTLEDAVGKALCALSSDELRLLDQATLSLLYQNGPSRQPSFPNRTVANSDNK